MSTNPLPTSLYEGLLLKLATILELTQKLEGTTPQAKQALLQAVCIFPVVQYLAMLTFS